MVVPEAPVIETGLNEHVMPAGSPMQDSATLLVNPFNAATAIVAVAELPAVTGVGESPEWKIWKPGCGGPALVVLNSTATPVGVPTQGVQMP